MYTIHGTKKLLDRVKAPIVEPVPDPSTQLGNWYATALFWKPQVALFVNEATLLPVFVPLAPAADLADRFPLQLGQVLEGLGVGIDFVLQEVGATTGATWAKTANRSVVGSMTDFCFLADHWRNDVSSGGLVELSVDMADTPCGPLYSRTGFPKLEVLALVEQSLGDGRQVTDSD